MAGSGFAAAFFAGDPTFVTVDAAFLRATGSVRFAIDGLGVGLCLTPFAGGFVAAPEEACRRTAFFAREIAACASRSNSCMWGAPSEDRSVTFNINDSILAIRLRTFFAFMTTPFSPH
jgi:hypothetical protein